MTAAKRPVLCVVGTRPEAVKMAPIILELRRHPEEFDVAVMATAQHRQMLDQVMRVFRITPDFDLNIMTADQTLADVTSRVLQAMDRHLAERPPRVVLAQGDTTTVMATATACFYRDIPFGHVEAGLRTNNLRAPFPEEYNRRLAGLLAAWHFAPTENSRRNLLREHVPPETVHVTGNPVIDALRLVLATTTPPPSPLPAGAPYVLMTCHRRESFGEGVLEIFRAVHDLARARPNLHVWYPVHPNPRVAGPAHEILGGLPNVLLTAPLDYVAFVHAMNGARLILSDSGGVQEEAPSLGKPVLVLRDNTERPEAVEAGTCRLVGPHYDRILEAANTLLDNPDEYQRMTSVQNPFGDGHAAERIAAILAGRPAPAF